MAKNKAETPDDKSPGWRIRAGSQARQDAEDRYSHPERGKDEPTGGRHAAPPDDVEGYRPGRR
jgi:hypothetical protein